ncbi:Uncharacterised protein [Vibrio cholerae]|nr:Uncharacterised protein [Vibrio cholerae]CSD14133.1 Uncharacterised protein [Vibrio cholerae]CSI46063.1 Uncharacterised protein [Vibrio cholerae]
MNQFRQLWPLLRHGHFLYGCLLLHGYSPVFHSAHPMQLAVSVQKLSISIHKVVT